MLAKRAGLFIILSCLVVVCLALQGCKLPEPGEEKVDMGKGLEEALNNPPPRYEVRIELVNVREGTEEEQLRAQKRLVEDFGRAAYPWIISALGEKQSMEVEDRLTEIAVRILLKDAGSVRESFRVKAVRDLVSIDKRFGILDELLLRLENADQRLSNSVFRVLEERKYISGQWSWADQAWEELSARFDNNLGILKRYIVFKLSSMPEFNPRNMNWDDFDRMYAFTVLSELVISENYTDLAMIFVNMLTAYAPRVRQEAARVLGYLGYTGAAPKLTELLTEDPSLKVRAATAEALGRMKAEDISATTLVVLLRKGELLGSRVCWALGEMKSQKAVGALIGAIENPSAMIALGKIGNELAVKPLVRVLEESNDISKKSSAAWALGNFNSQAVLQDLKKNLPDELSREVQAELVFSIFKIDPKAHEAVVRDRLTDYNPEIRLSAMVLLLSKGMIRNISVIKIMELLESIPTEQRVSYWQIVKNAFESIPPYHTYGLSYKREKEIAEINKWFNNNRSRFYWDEAVGKIKIK